MRKLLTLIIGIVVSSCLDTRIYLSSKLIRRLIILHAVLLFLFSNVSAQITATPAVICGTNPSTLSITAQPGATGYQWQISTTQTGSYTNVGTSSLSYSAPTVGWYRVIVLLPVNDTLGPIQILSSVPPTVNFSFSPLSGCSNVPVVFNNTSSTGMYLWNFADPASGVNNTSTLANPSHIFITNPGTGLQTFSVKLIVTNSAGCKDSLSVDINKIKRASGLLTSNASNNTFNGQPYFVKCQATPANIRFYNASTTIGTNTNYQIIWGDLSPDFNSNSFSDTAHTYNVGNYAMLYIVKGPAPDFCPDTSRYNVFVGSTPAGNILSPGTAEICSGSSLTFPIQGTTNNPPGTIYTVHFNDGSPDSVYSHPPPISITHTFPVTSCGITTSTGANTYPNSYGAYLSITNPCGPAGGAAAPIYVSQIPNPNFTIAPRDTVCVGTSVTFTNTSTGGNTVSSGQLSGNCTPAKIIWSVTPATGWNIISGSLGNDFGSTSPNPWISGSAVLKLNFTTVGTYTIKLKIGSNDLCGGSEIIKTICVNPTPVAAFDVNNTIGCAPLNVNTTNNSNSPLCGPNTYLWSVTYASTTGCFPQSSGFVYTNGTSATSPNPQFQFNNPGIYTITLITKSSAGTCISLPFTQTITVKAKPVVTLASIPASICAGGTINPTATSTCYINGTTTYLWSFPGGSPSTSTSATPGTITYATPGSYTVSLAVTNECGTTNLSSG